jgi:hypothetical protein
MSDTITNIEQASAASVLLAQSCEVLISSGQTVSVKRLSWIHFELLWNELAGLLAPLLSASLPAGAGAADAGPANAGVPQFEAQLAAAPGFVLRLTSLCSGLSEAELAQMDCDDVLGLGAAALELNFVQGVGVRRFFAAVAALA